jgi:hypothetical protein
VLGKGHQLQLPRSGLDRVKILDRTSAEIIFDSHRNGANDWDAYIMTGGVVKQILHAGDRNIASGLAGLDSNAFVRDEQTAFMIEAYENHLGAVDNFTQVVTDGNGTATPDAANHEMDLSSGAAVTGAAIFRAKPSWTLGTKPMTANFIIQNIVAGSSSKYESFFGYKNNHASDTYRNHAVFHHDYTGIWRVSTADAGAEQTTGIGAVSNGDVLSIIATSSKVLYFVNGVLVGEHTANIPTATLKFGACIVAYAAGAAVARTVSIDYMSMKKYV